METRPDDFDQTSGRNREKEVSAWRCDLCGGEDFQSISPMIVCCARCALVMTYPVPDDKELEKRYGADYYLGWDGSRSRGLLWNRRLRIIQTFIRSGRLLDVGCGTGEFLNVARQAGFEVAGTEFSPAARALVRNTTVYRDPSEAPGQWDAVTLWHVLEHARSPRKLLLTVSAQLKPQGFLFVALPNFESRWFNLVYRCVKGRWPELYSPVAKEPHLFHFSKRTLGLLLELTGFITLRMMPDVPDADFRLRLVDLPARLLFRLLKINWTLTLLTVAIKK